MHDIVIVGAGTAGMTSAIYGLRAGKKVLLIESESFGGQIIYSPQVENYPGIQKISGTEFAANLLEQAKSLGAEVIQERVINIKDENGQKTVVTENQEYPCKSVVIATGSRHRHLGLPKEEALIGAGVSYCAVCDGAFFKGGTVAVAGGGNTALQDALFLSEYCKKVYVIHRRDEFRGDASLVAALKEKGNVELVLSAVIKEIKGSDFLEGLVLTDKKTGEDRELEIEGLFVAIGQVPANETFADIIHLDEYGYVLASEDCMTSKPGVFAAGDCRTKEVRQLTTAAADGAVAALAACKYIDGQI